MTSKRSYVNARTHQMSMPALVDLARRVSDEGYRHEDLDEVLAQLGGHGVGGELKNIIFAGHGPKPEIVLRDALNNVIEITKHEEHCLVYDRPLLESGLSWRDLVSWWWQTRQPDAVDERSAALALYDRLRASLTGNDAELLIFRTYCSRFGHEGGFDLPALLPQVYLHYDPYSQRRFRDRTGPLRRQRMDFLLLLPQRVRVVVEVDGVQHYATQDRRADPRRYADMVSEDRALRLVGYEVYRFGGQELVDKAAASEMVNGFFDALFERHQIGRTVGPHTTTTTAN